MAFGIKYNLWLCDKDYNKMTIIDYTFLQYSIVINAVSQAYFTVETQSPNLAGVNFDPLGKIYTCIIEREGVERFRGEIDLITTPGNNTPIGIDLQEAYGSLDRIAFNASSISQGLDSLIAAPDAGSNVYKRSFNGQDLGTIMTTLITEAAARPDSPVAPLLPGTIEAPVDVSGNAITLGSEQALYGSSYLTWLRTLAQISNADWYIRDRVYLDFVKQKGSDVSDKIVFTLIKGEPSNNLTGITLNVDRQQLKNKIIVVGALDGINQVNKEASSSESIKRFKLREGVIPSRVIDTPATAQVYANSYLKQVSQTVPINSINMYPDQRHVAFGNFGLGDTVMLKVDMDFIRFSRPIRVVGAVITVEQNAVERIYYSLQEPLA